MSELVKLQNGVLVSELKRDCIENIIQLAEKVNTSTKSNRIDKILLFGSALESRCTEESDIDIAVFTRFDKSSLYKKAWYISFLESIYTFNMAQDYDILDIKTGYSDDSLIMKEILSGKVIYESI